MEKFIQHENLFIRHFSTKVWPFPLHNHNHYELMFIHRGAGVHSLNDIKSNYKGQHIFVLAPNDYHTLSIVEETEFTVLKFNKSYLNGFYNANIAADWNKIIDYLHHLTADKQAIQIKDAQEIDKISRLMHLITEEWLQSLNANNQVVLHLIRAVFALIWKNVAKENQLTTSIKPIISVSDYIHLHINQPEKLKIEHIAKQFNLSANYLNFLFKKEFGETIKQYVDKSKYKLLENRLKFGESSIKEISNEFGFNDLSHFNKFVKKQSGYNPKHLKKLKA